MKNPYHPDSLFVRLVKSRNFPESDFLQAILGERPSFAWRSVLDGRELMKEGIQPGIGNNSSLKLWIDLWMEDDEGVRRPPWRKNYTFDVNLMVSDIIDVET